MKNLTFHGGKVFNLYPLGDLHLGDRACDEKKLRDTMEVIRKDKSGLVIGMGDYADFITPADTKRFNISSIKNRIMVQDMIGASVHEVVSFLRPVKDKIIGLLKGNHEDTLAHRCFVDPMSLICSALGVVNLGMECFVILRMNQGTMKSFRTLDIYCHHGWGGVTTTEGAVMTRYARSRKYVIADLFLFGHSHQRSAMTFQRMRPQGHFLGRENPRVIHEEYSIVNTGGFLGRAEYSVRKGYEPQPTGSLRVKIISRTHRAPDLIAEPVF